MKRLFSYILPIIIGIFLFDACATKETCKKEIDVSKISVKVNIERLDKALFKLETKAEIQSFLEKNPLFTKKFLQKNPHDSVLINNLYNLTQNPYIDSLYQDCEKSYQDMKGMEEEFEQAFKHIKYYYPNFHIPQIQTIITGFGNDLYVSDSLIVIGLEFFLGEKAKYRPPHPNYILKRYEKSYIVPTCVQLIAQKYIATDMLDQTLLADMVYYGKLFSFTEHMIPCIADSLVIGYSQEQIELAEDNKKEIWAHFIEKKLLYATSHLVKKDYIDDAPFTLPISQKCPGSIGRWLGGRIVRKYLEKNPTVSLPQFMQNKNAKNIFTQSGYKGE